MPAASRRFSSATNPALLVLRWVGVSSLFPSETGGRAWARATAARSKTAPRPPLRRAEQERRRAKAARQRQSAERYDQLNDPSASPADVAEILAAELPDRVLAADMMLLRMSLGVPAEEVTETARLLLERAAPEPPGIGALAVAALAAHLAGDEEAEHGYARELLARADASRDPGQWLEVIRSATGRDHPGETCELIEPYLREHPDDELAADIYARALAKAHVQAAPGELEKAALGRYATAQASMPWTARSASSRSGRRGARSSANGWTMSEPGRRPTAGGPPSGTRPTR